MGCGGSGRNDAAALSPAQRQAQDPDYVCLAGAPERCGNAWDDNCNGLFDEGCGLNTGLAQFLIAWDAPGADLDLDVIDPRGQLAEVDQITAAGLIKERDCPGRNDDCKGARLENVYLEAGRALASGTYTVRVRLITLRDRDQPVRVALSVRLGDQHHAQRFALGHEGDEQKFTYDYR
jgi:tRNA (guanosine-2'-O-)-methyltransferase